MEKKTKIATDLTWYIDHKELLNINNIEKQLSMPQGTLRKFVDGKRGLAEQWHSDLIRLAKKMKK